MVLTNKLGITDSAELARQEERINKKKALELFETGYLLKKEMSKVVDWSKVDKEDYLLAMERSPIRDIEIKHILKVALTDEIHLVFK